MVKFFVALGLALLAGGAYAIVDGWPYLVLERGLAEVILGGLSACAGVILLAVAMLLSELRRLKSFVAGASPTPVPAGPLLDKPSEPIPAVTSPESPAGRDNGPDVGAIAIATTMAAGTGALVLADRPGRAASDAADKAPADDPVPAEPVAHGQADAHVDADAPAETAGSEPPAPPSPSTEAPFDEPAQPGSPGVEPPSASPADDVDDWLLPPRPDAAVTEPSVRALDAQSHAAQDAGITLPAAADEPGPGPSGRDEESTAEPDEARHETEDTVLAVDSTPEQRSDDAPGERPWWPRIEPKDHAADPPVEDEFSALRHQLTGSSAEHAPEVQPPRRDPDPLVGGEGWMAPRPWPPVTHPRDAETLADGDKAIANEMFADAASDDDGSSIARDGSAEERTDLPLRPDLPPAATLEAPGPEPVEPQDTAPDSPAAAEERFAAPETSAAPEAAAETQSADEPDAADEPAASDEGVIGAYQVGETQFTMFADGSIHARTPDGDYTFASMDELKAYLASEKDRLET